MGKGSGFQPFSVAVELAVRQAFARAIAYAESQGDTAKVERLRRIWSESGRAP